MNLKPFCNPVLINILSPLIIAVIILITISSNNLNPIEIISSLAIKDLIAILSISVFVIGISFILGSIIKQSQDYHFKNFEFSIKYQILIFGGMYVLYIIYVISAIFYDISAPLLLFIPLLLILHGYCLTTKFETVTLKMVTFDEQGSKKIETRDCLDLYEITDKDYRFKNREKNEFIIPNNQVLEIIYSDKLNKIEKKPDKHRKK